MALWVKLSTDLLSDPVLMRAARKGARELALLPWLLLFAKKADDDGRLTVGGEPAELEELAHGVPGFTPRRVAQALEELQSTGHITCEGGVLRIADWSQQQGAPSDSPSAVALRVRRHRDKKRRESALHETSGNALHETPDNGTEREREKEREKERERDGNTSAAAPLSPAELPAAAIELLAQLSAAKQPSAEREMRHALNGGMEFKGQRIQTTAARLEAKCRDTLIAIDRGKLTNARESAWSYTLTKLADTSDGSAPGAVAARELRDRDPSGSRERSASPAPLSTVVDMLPERETFDARKARADRIAAARPQDAQRIEAAAATLPDYKRPSFIVSQLLALEEPPEGPC